MTSDLAPQYPISGSNAADYKKQQTERENAAQGAIKDEITTAQQTYEWLYSSFKGTLNTIQNSEIDKIENYPYGSVVPFALDSQGRPFVLIADMAAHTRNLDSNPKASLLVSDQHAEEDPQASWRVTLFGEMTRLIIKNSEPGLTKSQMDSASAISKREFDELFAVYRNKIPAAGEYLKTHKFFFWRMNEVTQVRYIKGFGKICYVSSQELTNFVLHPDRRAELKFAKDHMNEDHLEHIKLMIQAEEGFSDEVTKTISVSKMSRMDYGGCVCEYKKGDSDSVMCYIRFRSPKSAMKPDGLRVATIECLRDAKKTIANRTVEA